MGEKQQTQGDASGVAAFFILVHSGIAYWGTWMLAGTWVSGLGRGVLALFGVIPFFGTISASIGIHGGLSGGRWIVIVLLWGCLLPAMSAQPDASTSSGGGDTAVRSPSPKPAAAKPKHGSGTAAKPPAKSAEKPMPKPGPAVGRDATATSDPSMTRQPRAHGSDVGRSAGNAGRSSRKVGRRSTPGRDMKDLRADMPKAELDMKRKPLGDACRSCSRPIDPSNGRCGCS